MRRLLLVRHAPTAATRRRVLPADEPLDAAGFALAAGLRGVLPPAAEAICSPAIRARQTAEAAGLRARCDPRLAECDFGAWAGRSLAELHRDDAAGVERWMTDADARPPGGETLAELCVRVAGWLQEMAGGDAELVAVTHGGVIRAAVVHALDAPPAALWRIDVGPLTITELHAHDGAWTVRGVNVPADRARPDGPPGA